MNRLLYIVVSIALLAGCGGGGGGGGNDPSAPSQGFVEFTRTLAATMPDASEPAEVDSVTVTTADDAEPEQVS